MLVVGRLGVGWVLVVVVVAVTLHVAFGHSISNSVTDGILAAVGGFAASRLVGGSAISGARRRRHDAD